MNGFTRASPCNCSRRGIKKVDKGFAYDMYLRAYDAKFKPPPFFSPFLDKKRFTNSIKLSLQILKFHSLARIDY